MFVAHKKTAKCLFESLEVFIHLKILLLIFKRFHCCLINPLRRVIEAINFLRHEIYLNYISGLKNTVKIFCRRYRDQTINVAYENNCFLCKNRRKHTNSLRGKSAL
jgi:hypothetical protein